ncbi:hypothetical protein pb186bvf_016053 [Paramecium bursaria]
MRNNVSGIQTKNQYPQQQQQLQVQRQLQGETQYTIYKDLENFLGVLVESNVVCSELDKDDPLVDIHRNRLIAQLNLSKSIHYDTQSTAFDNNNYDQLSVVKNDALNIIQLYLKQRDIRLDGRIEQYLDEYIKILERRQETLQITKLIPTNRINNLQESQINNLLNSMNAVDQDYQRLRKGEQFQLDEKKLFQRINTKISLAEDKIKTYKQTSSWNQKQRNPQLEQQQDKQKNNQDEPVTPESIQIIKSLILVSYNKDASANIAQVQEIIKKIYSQNSKRQTSNQNQKVILDSNPYLNRVVKDIQSIISLLNQNKQVYQMVNHLQSYLSLMASPTYDHWKNLFTSKDIEIIDSFIIGQRK